MRDRILAAAVLAASALLPVVPVHAQATAPGAAKAQMAAADQQWMKDLGEGNVAEIDTGKLAQQKGASAEVKRYGAMMAEDHGKALKELQALASRKGVELPRAPNARHAGAARSLEALRDDAFDKRYAAMAVSDHQETLALLKKVQQGAKDPDLRSFAGETIPVVSHHLAEAQKLPGGGK